MSKIGKRRNGVDIREYIPKGRGVLLQTKG